MKTFVQKIFLALAWFAGAQTQIHAQGTAMTYQGRLNYGGGMAGGSYDFVFSAYDAAVAGNQVSILVTNLNVGVTNGLFMTTIDFGAGVFPGPDRWLNIAVETNGAGGFTNLSPRQQITATPYAVQALNAGTAASYTGGITDGQLSGNIARLNGSNVFSGTAQFVNAGGSFTGNFSGNGTSVTNVGIGALNTFGDITWPGNFMLTSTPVTGFNSNPNSLAVADVNGDGKLDLVSANGNFATLSIFTNDGSGYFALSSSPSVLGGPTFVTTADINGDGKVDLICSYNSSPGTFSVLTNNGSGRFAIALTAIIGGTGGYPVGIAVADINGDGKADLISANFGSGGSGNTLSIMTNNGAGGFSFATSLIVGGGPYSVTAADVNGDGKMDLVSANRGANSLTVLANNGSGGFTLVTNIATGVGPQSVSAVDVNGDGKVDLVSANYYSGTLSVLTNNGSGGFALATSPAMVPALQWATAADVNGDGRPDFIGVSSTLPGTLTVLTNGGSSFSLAASLAVGNYPIFVAAADLNGDGKPDLVSVNDFGGSLSVLFNTLSFNGNGAALNSLNASNLATGTVADSRLSTNVTLLNANQAYSGVNSFSNAANSFAGTFTGNGTGVTNVNAATLGGLAKSAYWQLGGNTVAGGQFLGSLNNQALEFWVNNLRALRLEPGAVSGSPNVIGGSANNSANAGAYGVVVGGGMANQAGGIYAVVGGGQGNSALGANSTVSGGEMNKTYSSAFFGTVSGGRENEIFTGYNDVIAGGYQNLAQADYASVLGGFNNQAGSLVFGGTAATVGGGSHNYAYGNYSGIASGTGNLNSGDYSVIAGGANNGITGDYSTVAGGSDNNADGDYAFAAGHGAQAEYNGAFVWADSQNVDFVSGTNDEFIVRAYHGVGINTTKPKGALSVNYTPGAEYDFPEGGSIGATLVLENDSPGGMVETAYFYKTNLFWENTAMYQGGNPCFIFGESMTLYSHIAYVNGDLSVQSNVVAQSFNTSSDRNLKTNFTVVVPGDILKKVAAMPITTWNFKAEGNGLRHLGPMAQDFYAAFGLGADDKHIATVDEEGVAFAAIQGLNQKLEETRAENLELKQSVADLKKLVQSIVGKNRP